MCRGQVVVLALLVATGLSQPVLAQPEGITPPAETLLRASTDLLASQHMLNAPQFTVIATNWNLEPSFTDATFSFTPPNGTQRVEFLPMGSEAAPAR